MIELVYPKAAIVWQWLILLALLGLTFFVLLHQLDRTSLWADEGWTIAATAESNPVKVVTKWVADDVHPPLFFIELNLWRKLTGETIFALRYFSVLITWVGVALMYRLGKAMFSARAGILAALFFGLHDLVRVLTQEVRHYPQQQTATILVLWLYWRFWQKPTRRRGAAFAISGALLIYSHYWGGFVLLALTLHALVTRHQKLKPYLLASMGIALLYLPWLPVIYHQITIERPRGLPHALENSWLVYKTLAYQLAGTPELLWILLAGVGTLGVWAATRHDWQPTPAGLLPALVIILTIGLSLLVNTRYATLSFRSLAVVIPPLALLIAHALARFQAREQFVMVTFLLVHSLATTAAAPVERPPWPAMADFIGHHSTEADLTLLEMDTDEYAFAYYLDHSGAKVRYISTENVRLTESISKRSFTDYLTETLNGIDGLWVAKFGYYAYDIRQDLEALGFVQTATPLSDWGHYVDGRPIELLRYDQPAVEPLVSFGDTMRLMRHAVTRHDAWVTVNLLWSPATPPDRNYSVSTFLLAQSGLPAAPPHDSYPFEFRSPTINWQANSLYFDSHVHSTKSLPPGRYQVGVKVYFFLDADFTRLEIALASDCSANAACEYIIIGELTIE